MNSSQVDPKLRRDLVISRQETPEGLVFVLKDPVRSRFFHFREVEKFIANELDGVTSLQTIQQRVEEKFGSPLSLDTLLHFTENLRKLGLLEGDQSQWDQPGASRRRVRGSLLFLRLKAFDPDRLLNQLRGKLGFFFTPAFLTVSAVLILFAFLITFANWQEIGRDFHRLYRFDVLLLAWLTLVFVATLHEFAHGLTCKYFGGEVHEMGFMLLYFQPAFYCNVSDAWLFPEKSKRLWVTFAGAYFELFIWALATLAWRVTEPDVSVNFLALLVMATSGIKIFFNLHPLIKLDGYYLLSDYLDVPNLRQRSFAYVGSIFRRLLGLSSAATAPVSPRMRRIYLIYGLLAGAYSYSLLFYIARGFGNYLIQRYEGLGFALYAGLLMIMFQNPLKRSFPKFPMLLARWRTAIMSLNHQRKILLSLAIVAILVLGRMDLKISGEFETRPTHNADVRAEVEGMIEEVYVNEGDFVEKGQPIARLSGRQYLAELGKADAEIEEKKARLRLLSVGSSPQEIELARKELQTAETARQYAKQEQEEAQRMQEVKLAKEDASLARADEQLRYARSDLSRSRRLFEEGLVSRRQLEEAEERTAVREKERDTIAAEIRMISADKLAGLAKGFAIAQEKAKEATVKLQTLLAGSRREAIEAAQAEVARVDAERRYLHDELGLIRVVSPISGIVTTSKPKEKIGQHVTRGDLIVEVYELNKVLVEIGISEREISDVKVGQNLALRARALPGTGFSGVVTTIASTATQPATGGTRVVIVTTEVDNTAHSLKPGMTGNAKISGGKRPIIALLTRRVAHFFRVEFWSWW